MLISNGVDLPGFPKKKVPRARPGDLRADYIAFRQPPDLISRTLLYLPPSTMPPGSAAENDLGKGSGPTRKSSVYGREGAAYLAMAHNCRSRDATSTRFCRRGVGGLARSRNGQRTDFAACPLLKNDGSAPGREQEQSVQSEH